MSRSRWSTSDLAQLRRVYARGGMQAARAAFPDRTYGAIYAQVKFHGFRRGEDESVSDPRLDDRRTSTSPPIRESSFATASENAAWRNPALEKVPETAIGLPWVTYPRDLADLRAILDATLAAIERESSAGPVSAVVGFFQQQAAYVGALIDRAARQAA